MAGLGVDPMLPGTRRRGKGGASEGRVPKSMFENLLFACRWLLTPFYVALVVALLALLGKVATRAYGSRPSSRR